MVRCHCTVMVCVFSCPVRDTFGERPSAADRVRTGFLFFGGGTDGVDPPLATAGVCVALPSALRFNFLLCTKIFSWSDHGGSAAHPLDVRVCICAIPFLLIELFAVSYEMTA